MIPNRTARNSKKGDKTGIGQASHDSRQRVGQDSMVHRTQFGLAAPVSETEMSGGETPFHP